MKGRVMKRYSNGLSAWDIRNLVGEGPLMLEVGCHDGWPPLSHTLLFLEAMPKIELHCFEPDERPIEDFHKHFDHDPRVTLHEMAVGEVDGTTPFYASTGAANILADWSLSGSKRRPTGHLARAPEIKFKPPVNVPCIRLDSWLALHAGIDKIDFMWVDVQGAQDDFIVGANKALGITRYLYIECHEAPQYEGEPEQEEMVAALSQFGFTPMALYEGYNFLLKNSNF